MATRAEWFRYQQERSGPKKPKAEPKVPRGGVPAPHNLSDRAGRKAAYALEDSPGARPSRKSTRKASNRQKTDAKFRLKRATHEGRPPERPGAGR
jgi:hypothetical protein